MKLTMKFAGASVMALALTGCFDGSSSHSNQGQQPAMSVDFETFVRGELENPNPNREPANVNGVDFSFNNQDDPRAYDDLLK
ncbi:MAG: hypothetical protein ACTHY7_03815 [Marinobacter sp.]|uniref:hypothetical protein n=1 Tax=Marinobacter sp. TaxID=50741 RepID=UPI003F9AEBC8